MPILDDLPDMPGYHDALLRRVLDSKDYARLPFKNWTDPIPKLAFPEVMEKLSEKLEQVSRRVRNEYQDAANALTEKQLIDALMQAFASGDFLRLVTQDGTRQGVVYIPFREVECLKSKIRELEEKITDLERDAEDKAYGEDL